MLEGCYQLHPTEEMQRPGLCNSGEITGKVSKEKKTKPARGITLLIIS